MKVYFLVVFCLLVVFQCLSQSPNIPFIKSEIKVDGAFDEAVWDGLPNYTGFYNYLPTDIGLAKNQTVVRLFHNGEYLFISAVYNDTTSKTQVSTLKRDVSIALSDAFVMVLDTQNQQQNAYFFAVNSLGNQSDGLVGRSNDGYNLNFSWNTVWKSATLINGVKKQYEVAIPLKAFNFNKNSTVFGIQFYSRDIKNNSWTILKNVKRNYPTFDLRFTEKFTVEALPDKSVSRFSVTPSFTINHQNDLKNKVNETDYKPSLDVQYNVTSSLKLDATINPDFSQVDVDQQVTNLTRFSIFFPERRNFFLENSDLFSNLGVDGVNPFYSRRIGSESSILFGLKLSGNVSSKARVGFLNLQTEEKDGVDSENFGTIVLEQQFSKNITATGFLVNRQATEKFNFINDYNRVTGINLNYKSNDKKWIGLGNVGKSFNNKVSDDTNFYHVGVWFNKRKFRWNTSVKHVEKNYITDVGFTPRLLNYDAVNEITVREGYTHASLGFQYRNFYEKSKTLNSIRYLNYSNNTYFDTKGKLNQATHFINSAIFFRDMSDIYYVYMQEYVNLKYGFDPLGNGNALIPGEYNFGVLKVGYESANYKKVRYQFNAQKGGYYGGKRIAANTSINYQLLPFANLEASYDINKIDLGQLGKKTFHLAKFTGEVFFSNSLNWTTYVQYNTQWDNFNINSRIQWEYKPLSYLFIVISDNYNQHISRKNWGIAFKMNYRLDL